MNKDEEEDEDDYMSDKYLLNESKPGLMPKLFLDRHKRGESSTTKKKNTPKPKQDKHQSVKVKEHENRKKKLDQALDESNKGFAMLARMGFKKGMGLGKDGQGRSDPIPIDIKTGRGGVGKTSEEERKRTKRLEMYRIKAKRRKEDEEHLKGDFKSRMRSKINERQVFADLCKSQKACHQLDHKKGMEEPIQSWYWTKQPPQDDEEQEVEEVQDEVEEDDNEKLVILTCYLRTEHRYCIWCGITFNDENDLKENCPGDTFEDHQD